MTRVFATLPKRLKIAGLTLAALALFLKVLIPPGTMVAPPSADKSFPLMICTSQGAMAMPMADMGGHHDPADKGDPGPDAGHHHPCIFASASASPLTPSVAAAPPRAAPVYDDTFQSLSHSAPGQGLSAPPPPARAPPVLLT